jgi:hypothetical protein
LTAFGGTPANVRKSWPEPSMLDVVFIAATLAFFAVGALFVHACDHI